MKAIEKSVYLNEITEMEFIIIKSLLLALSKMLLSAAEITQPIRP